MSKRIQELVSCCTAFLEDAERQETRFFNEAELQHELGMWLRIQLPRDCHVYFERPAASFFPAAHRLTKKEIDLVISFPEEGSLLAIELKCPRRGRIPETMFDACRDLRFLEELNQVGFKGGLFLMHVEDPGFHSSGQLGGIYSYFRSDQPLTGRIQKPTGAKDALVVLSGSYRVDWMSLGDSSRYWLRAVEASSP